MRRYTRKGGGTRFHAEEEAKSQKPAICPTDLDLADDIALLSNEIEHYEMSSWAKTPKLYF